MRYIISAVLLVAIHIHCFSQEDPKTISTCKITGIVIDSTSEQPIEYATVSVFKKGDSKPVNGMITDSKGAFQINDLKPDVYSVKIDFISYQSKTINNVVLTNRKKNADIGEIFLSDNSKSLQGVTVTGQRSYMENHIDKLVFNVEKDITSQGGTATDVLKKVPQVSVDVDGNVELLGNSNVRIFINGKPSAMFDNDLADALQAIPASQIKSIEVITSPGAKYDAEGTAGIINIVLKDNKSHGINGNVTLSGGTRLENGSANINARKGAFSLNASLSGNAMLPSTTPSSLNRIATDSSGNKTGLIQNGQGTTQRTGYRAQIGAEWNITKKDDITVSISENEFGYKTNGPTNQQEIIYAPNSTGILNDISTLRTSNNNFTFRSLDWNVDYKKTFNTEGQELDISYQQNNANHTTFFDQQHFYTSSDSLFSGAKGNNNAKDRETYLIIDYSQPINKKVSIDMGAKGSFSNIKSYADYYALDALADVYNMDVSQIDNFNYNQNVYAGYVSATYNISKDYKLKVGLRDEVTDTKADNSGIEAGVIPSYNTVVPTATLVRTFANNQTLKLSYTRRLERPRYRELNPFINATDPTNLSAGNPLLKPEIGHSVELSYFKTFTKGGSILVTGYYRYNVDDIQTYVQYYTSLAAGDSVYKNVAVTTDVNVGSQQLAGLNIYVNIPITQQLEIRGNFNGFDKYIVSNIPAEGTSNSFNYRSNINATYQLGNDIAFEFFGNFNSVRHEIQGTFPSFTTYNFAARKYLFKKKASIAFTTTDPFNKYVNQPTNVSGVNFYYVTDRKLPYRSFGLSISYKFGKMEYKAKKDDHTDENNPDDAN